MTVASIAEHIGYLLTGDPKEWKYLPYRVKMKCLGIDLSWVSAADNGISDPLSWHSNSGGPDLEVVLNNLDISSRSTVLDLGCGKGGAMITMARYPFGQIDGVEIAPKLAEIARTNLRRLRIRNACVYCCDASQFADLDPYDYIYMYNPFSTVIMRRVVENIQNSLRRRRRPLTIIYKNPICQDILVEACFQKVREFDHSEPAVVVFAI